MGIIAESFNGNHVFVAADSCYSGAMVDIAISFKTPDLFIAALSSTSMQVAWSRWRFARCLLRGLKGDAIHPGAGGGALTLQGLADYTKYEMSFYADGIPTFKASDGLDASKIIVCNNTAQGVEGGPLRVTAQNRRAQVVSGSYDGQLMVEMCSNDALVRVEASSVTQFKWREFDIGSQVQCKSAEWKAWVEGYVEACYEHMFLISFQASEDYGGVPGRLWLPSDCLRLPGEEGRGVIVTGAGCEQVNGVYAADADYNGHKMYTCADNGLQLWYNGQWRIGRTNDYYYTCDEGEPVGVSSWHLASFQSNPAAEMPPPQVLYDKQ